MAQTLLLGLGGTGSRVVNNVVKELHLNKKEINDGEICCAVLDTNVNDNEKIEASGTQVPVIPTSSAKKIREYFEDYHHLHMETWCPQSPSFMEQTMIDGASELRLKSRIAFMDCLENGKARDLEYMINDVLKNSTGSKIRVMIVSSLSGGTGSGMFIQVALWLRKILKNSDITIRGIFMLPDVFISTLDDIRKNKATMTRHYCNAYAAIRELNTITKIMKNNDVELPERITIGDLFDSLVDKDSGKPVYDFAFFVDDQDENGVRLESIGEYEKMVAQLVYMQLYAPMKDDMYSEEDNAFLSFVQNDEPLYGSCGTSKAVYPRNSVKSYCAIRAAQDALTTGWKKIDDEIEALKEEKKQLEKDGVFTNEEINVRDQFIKLFDEKTAVKADEAAKDRFFLSISKDVKNEKTTREGDKTVIKYSDKVKDFVELIKSQKIDVVIARNSGTEDFSLDAEAFVAADHTKQELLDKVASDTAGLDEVLDKFDKKVPEYADAIVNSVFPYSMGEVKAANRGTIYGLLSKPGENGKWNFIHPVAARYVLYKLVASLERAIKGIALKDSRDEARSGGYVGTQFDNKATQETEVTAEQLLNSKKWYQREETFLDDFERRYAEFITSKIVLCEKYEREALQLSVYQKLSERVKGLIDQFEAFFAKLGDVSKRLDQEIEKNVAMTNGVVGKTLYVFGSKEAKEFVYNSLDIDQDSSSSEINKSVIDSIYGSYCAEKRPNNTENEKYLDVSAINAFVGGIVAAFRERIDKNKNNNEQVNLDIYTAICREYDAVEAQKAAEKQRREREEGHFEDPLAMFDNVDFETGDVKKTGTGKEEAYRRAFAACRDKLYRMAAPFLIHDTEISDNELGTITTRNKTFWGFSPEVPKRCEYLGRELGINVQLQENDAYPQNELYCYRAVYGMEAAYIPKFNELKKGDYYTCYNAIIKEMVQDVESKKGERAYIVSPHLDMHWHKFLPYITEQKREQEELVFFHGLFLAMAYGKIKVDKKGEFYITRSIDGGYGNYITEDVAVLYKEKPVTKVEVAKLIQALKTDKIFTDSEIPEMEKKFAEELEEMTTYVGTEAFQGLTTKKEDLNPINIVTRYNESLGHQKTVSAALIAAIEKIAMELAEKYNVERDKKQLEVAKYRLCRRIYDSSKRTKGKSTIFGCWESAFDKLKIKEDDSGANSSK